MKQKIILTIIFLLYLLIILKVTSLSVVNHKLYTDLANNNIHKKIYIKPIRGIIYDTNNNPIAYNELRFALLLKPHLKNNELNNTVKFINKYISIDTKKIIKTYKKQNSWYNHTYINVLDYIEYNKIYPYFPTLIQNKNIKIESDYLRIYPQKEILSHILGYVGKANQQQINKTPELQYIKITGKSGIEKEYNKELTGKLGYINVIVNAKNKIIKKLGEVKPVSHNITLNINTKLQQFIYNLFKKSNKKGTIIVMNVKGQIIAMVNYPSYDNNLFVQGISTKKWNKTLSLF